MATNDKREWWLSNSGKNKELTDYLAVPPADFCKDDFIHVVPAEWRTQALMLAEALKAFANGSTNGCGEYFNDDVCLETLIDRANDILAAFAKFKGEGKK